jgi:predicted SAM-dependent methyltransferase
MIVDYFKNSLKLFLKSSNLLERAMNLKILQSIFKSNNQRILQKHHGKNYIKLHLGCGGKKLEGWINIDAVWRPNVVILTLPDGLKLFKNNSVEYIYNCHFLEHLKYPTEVMDLLTTCYRLLKPGGVMRTAVPDIEMIINAYVKNDQEFFEIQSQLHPSCCTTKLEHLMYALQQDGEHQYGYDFDTLEKVFLQAGFEKIIKCDFGQSTFESLKIDYREDIKNLTLFTDAIKAPNSKLI